MKKLLSILVALTCVFAFAGQALAFFEQGDLLRAVYSPTFERVQDISTAESLLLADYAAIGDNHVVPDTALNPLDFGDGMTINDLNFAYFGYDNATGDIYVSGGTSIDFRDGGWQNFFNAITSYQNGSTSSVMEQTISPATGYTKDFNSGGLVLGSFAGLLTSLNGEASIADGDVFVDQYLYKITYMESLAGGTMTLEDSVATIRTLADGSVVINPSAVPIPGAVWLLGSGLFGLIGIRRKNG